MTNCSTGFRWVTEDFLALMKMMKLVDAWYLPSLVFWWCFGCWIVEPKKRDQAGHLWTQTIKTHAWICFWMLLRWKKYLIADLFKCSKWTLNSHSEVAKFPKCEANWIFSSPNHSLTKKDSPGMRAIPKIGSLFFYSDKLQLLFQEGTPLYTLVQFFCLRVILSLAFWTKHLLRSTIICQVRYGNCETSRLKAIHAAAQETAFPASFVQVVKDAHKKWGAEYFEEIRKGLTLVEVSANLDSWCIYFWVSLNQKPAVFSVVNQNEPSAACFFKDKTCPAQPLIFCFSGDLWPKKLGGWTCRSKVEVLCEVPNLEKKHINQVIQSDLFYPLIGGHEKPLKRSLI